MKNPTTEVEPTDEIGVCVHVLTHKARNNATEGCSTPPQRDLTPRPISATFHIAETWPT